MLTPTSQVSTLLDMCAESSKARISRICVEDAELLSIKSNVPKWKKTTTSTDTLGRMQAVHFGRLFNKPYVMMGCLTNKPKLFVIVNSLTIITNTLSTDCEHR